MQRFLSQARGDEVADLVFKNGFYVDVFNGSLVEDSLAINQGIILGPGDYRGKVEVDLKGQILCPGFIDGHLHLESAMVTVGEFARTVIPLGTTTVFADPHEIANVAGLEGIDYILKEGRRYPWNFNILVPSCVPASSFETPGHTLTAKDLEHYLGEDNVFGLGEIMDYPSVINGEKDIWAKISMFKDTFLDGHGPGLSGKALNAYCLAGIRADHEASSKEEALEKIKKGMYIMIREGSAARNLKSLLRAINDKNFTRFLLATDDRHPEDLVNEGHINFLIKKAVEGGLAPIRAICLATINAAQCFGLQRMGALAPGYKADLVVLDNLDNLGVQEVYKDGILVGREGKACFETGGGLWPGEKMMSSLRIRPFNMSSLEIPAGKYYRVIEIIPEEIHTKSVIRKLEVKGGQIISGTAQDICKLAVFERHHNTGNIALALLAGLGLKEGALASSVAHDSHHVIVAGVDDKDMSVAVQTLIKMQGGLVIVSKEEILGSLSLPLAGLMSTKKIEDVAQNVIELNKIARELGVTIRNPFMTLSFLALPVIPALKLTDLGLFDSQDFKFVPLVYS